MALYRRLLLRDLRCRLSISLFSPAATAAHPVLLTPSRLFAFSSAEEAAAERRRRKRRLRIEPPLHALRRDPSSPPPPRDPNAPRLPDTTSALVGPRLSLHNRVQSLIRSGDLDGASAAARAAVSSRVRPTVFTCNAVAAAMVRAGRHDDAVSLFDFFFRRCSIVPNVVSYNTLVLAHCEAARVDAALDAYRELLDNAPFSPSTVTYRHLTKGLVSASRIQDALDLLREMLNRGQGADSLVYNNLIAGYIDLDDWDKAFEIFDELRERCQVYYDGVIHTSFMEGYWRKGMDKEAMENYQSLLDRNFKMTPATCNVLLDTLFKHGKHKEAIDLWETMIDNHSPPTFIGINSESYSVMVNQCFKEGRFQEAIEVFHRQPRKNVQMDVACFNNIIGKLCVNGMLAEAEKLFEEMESKSVLPDVYTYTYLVDSCFKEGRVDDTMQYFYKMADGREHGPKFNIGFFNRMFEGLSEAGRIDDALKVYGRMPDKEIKPDTRTFEILVKILCKEGGLDRALDLVRDMARGSVVASPEFREYVVDIFKNADRQEEIEKAFEEKPAPLPPQPKPEYRPRSSPYASNQARGSYVPHQGQHGYSSPQPFHPGTAGSQVMHPKNADRQEEIEKAFEEKPVPLPPQPKPEYHPHNSPYASNQARGSYMPHQGQHGYSSPQPFHPGTAGSQVMHPEAMSPRPQQPVYDNAQVGKTGFGGHSPQHGLSAPQPRQPGYVSVTQQPEVGAHDTWQHGPLSQGKHQNHQPVFGASQPWQHAVGTAQAQRLDFSSAPSVQSGFGCFQYQEPTHSAPQTQQPGFGTSHPRQTVFGASQVQQPRYAAPAPLPSQHAVGSPLPPRPQFDAPHSPQSNWGYTQNQPGYGHIGKQNGQFGCPQGGQKIDSNPLQQGFGAQTTHTGYHDFQGQKSFEPRQGQVERGTQIAAPDYGAYRSQPPHGAAWSQGGYGLRQGQLGHGGSVLPHASDFQQHGMSLDVQQGQNNHGIPRVQYGSGSGQAKATLGTSSYERSGFGASMDQTQYGSSYRYDDVYRSSQGLQQFDAPHAKTETSQPEGEPEAAVPEGQQMSL